MLLALDLGNTSADAGLFDLGPRGPVFNAARKWPVGEIGRLLRLWRSWPAARRVGPLHLMPVAIASVNPPALRSALRAIRAAGGRRPAVLGVSLDPGIRTRVRRGVRVGADRLAAARSAFHRTRRATIVVDFGTALSFDVISARGEFLGGVIAPSPAVAARGLHDSCALLPLVAPRPVCSAIGRDTPHAIRSALHFGTPGMVRAILAQLRRELGGRPVVLATGGGAREWAGRIPEIGAIVPGLVLEGIALAHGCDHEGGGGACRS